MLKLGFSHRLFSSKAAQSLLASRSDALSGHEGIRVGLLLERLPLVQKGGVYGNPYLKGERTISPVTKLDDLHCSVSRLKRIKNESGKVFSGTGLITGDPSEQEEVDYFASLPPFAKRELRDAEVSHELPSHNVKRSKFDRLYMLVKGSDGEWSFPSSGVVTDKSGSLRLVGERVAARLLNGFSDGMDVTGVKTEEEIKAEADALNVAQEANPTGELSLKERRRRRKKLKEMKGNVEAQEGAKAKEEVPQYLSFIGNAPMGVIAGGGAKTYLFRAFVKDVDMVSPGDWEKLHDAIEENVGEVGWFTREEIVKGEMVKDEAGETTKFLDLLLQD